MKHIQTNLLFLLAVLQVALLTLPLYAETWTNLYVTGHFGPADDGSYTVDRYADLLRSYHIRLKKGIGGPLPEELPSHLDTNGNWGLAGAGFQLALRFQQPEFRAGEPVVALIYLRNISSPLEAVFIKNAAAPAARKNFSFELRQGAKTNQWSWTDPPPPDLTRTQRSTFGGYPHPYLAPGVLKGTQKYFVVRVDQMFDVSKTGEYSIKATWPVRAGKLGTLQFQEPGTNMTYISTGFAKFRVVEKP